MKKSKKLFIKRIIEALKNDELIDRLIKELDKTFSKDKRGRKRNQYQ